MHTDENGAQQSEPIGYPMPVRKLWIMCILTLNLYMIYWGYKQFLATKFEGKPKLLSWFYAFFLNISFYEMLKRIENQAKMVGRELGLNKAVLALAFFLPATLHIGLDKFLGPAAGFLTLATSIVRLLVLSKAQSAINKLNEGSNFYEGNSGIKGGELALAIFGGIVWLLWLLSAFMPGAGQN